MTVEASIHEFLQDMPKINPGWIRSQVTGGHLFVKNHI